MVNFQEQIHKDMFIASYNKGFSMKFDNGLEISVQWGTMNYCSKKGEGQWDESTKDTRWKSSTAEIAIFNNNVTDADALNGKDMVVFENDSVKGWCSADFVAEIIFKVSTATDFDALQQQVTNEKW